MSDIFKSVKFRDAAALIGLILISVVFESLSPTLMTGPNLLNILQQSSINACIALGMTLVIISGGIDLSVRPVAAPVAILGAAMIVAGVPVPLALLGALAAGVACGFGNGALIARGGLQPFIVTLGGQPIFGLPDGFLALTKGTLGGAPTPVIIAAVLAVVVWVILNKAPLGEYFMAIGGNPEATRIAGVPTVLTKLAAYMIFGFMAAVAAMILIGRLGAAEPTMGILWALDAIAAFAIGGASLMGGRGSNPGTLIGCIILGTLRNGLTRLNVQAFYLLLATGIIIFTMLIVRFAPGAGGGKQG